MKMVMSKPGPAEGTEFVDEMSLGLPSILQVGDTEFVHARVEPEVLEKVGSNYEHFMFLTPNDDDHFMLFTVDYYTGPDPDIFERLGRMRKRETPKGEVKPYDKRPLMPFRGNIRQEDIVTQGTQRLLGEREERLGTSDRGIIMLRRMIRDAIDAVAAGREPKALRLEEDAGGAGEARLLRGSEAHGRAWWMTRCARRRHAGRDGQRNVRDNETVGAGFKPARARYAQGSRHRRQRPPRTAPPSATCSSTATRL